MNKLKLSDENYFVYDKICRGTWKVVLTFKRFEWLIKKQDYQGHILPKLDVTESALGNFHGFVHIHWLSSICFSDQFHTGWFR